jgi:hypothetical protein
MFGAIIHKLLIKLGLKKNLAACVPTPPQDDFVARHGLSYGERPEPLTDEARTYIERLKTFRRTR